MTLPPPYGGGVASLRGGRGSIFAKHDAWVWGRSGNQSSNPRSCGLDPYIVWQ